MIVIENTFAFVPLPVVNPPLKNPVLFARGVHGSAKEAWATECVGG